MFTDSKTDTLEQLIRVSSAEIKSLKTQNDELKSQMTTQSEGA